MTSFVVPDERPCFLREVNNNMYTVSSYFLSKVASEVPISIAVVIFYVSLIYYPIGLNEDSDRFFTFRTHFLVYW